MTIYLVQSLLGILSVFVMNIEMWKESLNYCIMTNTIGSSVLTLKCCDFFLVSNVDTQSIPAFYIYNWDSRARKKHWVETNWSPRSENKPGDTNNLHVALADRKKIIFPPLHTKLSLPIEKIKAGVFDVHLFGRLSKMNISPGLCQTLRKMLYYHSKTSSKIFLEIQVKVITQKLLRKYGRTTKCLVWKWILS